MAGIQVGGEREAGAPGDDPAGGLRPFLRAPQWIVDLGTTAWLAVGVLIFIVGLVWILSLTQTIVAPLITAAVVSAVAAPLVSRLQPRLGRGGAAAVLLLALVVLSVAVVVMVLGGITSQMDASGNRLDEAKTTLTDWARDAGVSRGTAEAAKDDASSALTDAIPALLHGIGTGIKSLSGIAVFLSLTALSLFFLLKDGPAIRHWIEGNMRTPRPVAHGMTTHVLESLRGYFLGVTFVALFNAAVIGGAALILGVPLAGTIAVVNFLGAYVPYLGAWSAGAFAVLVALGGVGPEAALAMAVVGLLANGILQQMVQPIAFGAALKLHPLAVLVVTIAGGALFGAAGLILAAPLTAAATRIAADFSGAAEEAPT